MKNNKVFITLLLLFTLQNISLSQSTKSLLSGFGLEFGGGQNSMFWSAPFNIRTLGGVPADRTEMKFAPNIRITYKLDYQIPIALLPFLGYNQIGGSSNEDKYSFNSIEIGGFALYKLSNINFGIGIKMDYLLDAEYKLLNSNSKWDRSDWFTKLTSDVGLRASYSLKPFIIGVETWFGIINLASGATDGAKIYENHYRVLLGYGF